MISVLSNGLISSSVKEKSRLCERCFLQSIGHIEIGEVCFDKLFVCQDEVVFCDDCCKNISSNNLYILFEEENDYEF